MSPVTIHWGWGWCVTVHSTVKLLAKTGALFTSCPLPLHYNMLKKVSQRKGNACKRKGEL